MVLSSGTAGRSFRKFCCERNIGSSRIYGLGLVVCACVWVYGCMDVCIPGSRWRACFVFLVAVLCFPSPTSARWYSRMGFLRWYSQSPRVETFCTIVFWTMVCIVCSAQCAVIARLLLSCTVLPCPALSCPVLQLFPCDRCVTPPTMCIVPRLDCQSRRKGTRGGRRNWFSTSFSEIPGKMLVQAREETNIKSVINSDDWWCWW